MSDIRFLKLITGEEVLCVVVGESPDSYTIKNPSLVVPSGHSSMAIIPWMTMGEFEDSIVIKGDYVITHNKPIKEIRDQFNQMITGLVVPTSELKIVKD